MTSNFRTIQPLNLELCKECSRTLGRPGAGMAEDNADTLNFAEQQLRKTRSERSSYGGHDWGAAAEAGTIGEQQLRQMRLGCSCMRPVQ